MTTWHCDKKSAVYDTMINKQRCIALRPCCRKKQWLEFCMVSPRLGAQWIMTV